MVPEKGHLIHPVVRRPVGNIVPYGSTDAYLRIRFDVNLRTVRICWISEVPEVRIYGCDTVLRIFTDTVLQKIRTAEGVYVFRTILPAGLLVTLQCDLLDVLLVPRVHEDPVGALVHEVHEIGIDKVLL